MLIKIILSLVTGYLLGCLQTSYIAVRLIKKADIRELGSKNAGATNTTRVLGFKYGIAVGFVDVLKGFIAVLLVRWWFPESTVLMFLCGTSCILGHVFPFYLQFKGGKGVATTIGMLFAVNYIIGIVSILILVLVTLVTNYVALGSILIYILLPVSLYFFHYSMDAVLISLSITMLGIYKHRANISRMLQGKENGLIKR